jgi:hypothetical protein
MSEGKAKTTRYPCNRPLFQRLSRLTLRAVRPCLFCPTAQECPYEPPELQEQEWVLQ